MRQTTAANNEHVMSLTFTDRTLLRHEDVKGRPVAASIGGDMNPEEHYKKQTDDLADSVLLGHPILPEFETHQVPGTVRFMSLLKPLVWPNTGEVVAGSCISEIFHDYKMAQDIDIYFPNLFEMNRFCQLNNIKIDTAQACNASWYVTVGGKKINLIWGIPYKNTRELLAGFDIRLCAMAYEPFQHAITCVQGAIPDVVKRRIIYQTGARCATIARLLKYTERGFKIDQYQRCILAELIKNGQYNKDVEMFTGYRR